MYEVLWAAEMYFLQGLKRQCASIISRYTKAKNVISILQLARMFSLPRLEDHCVEFIANHLDMVSFLLFQFFYQFHSITTVVCFLISCSQLIRIIPMWSFKTSGFESSWGALFSEIIYYYCNAPFGEF